MPESRDIRLYLVDIADAIRDIDEYVEGMTYEQANPLGNHFK